MNLHRSILVLAQEFLETVVDLLAHEMALLNPAFRPAGGAHAHESPLSLEDFDAIAILHDARLVVDSGHAVTQRNL